MKKILCVLVSVLALLAMSSCTRFTVIGNVGNTANDKLSEKDKMHDNGYQDGAPAESVDLKELVGVYGEDGADIKLTVFDASKENGVFFELDLYDDVEYDISWAISGVALFESEKTFSFVIEGNGNPKANTGKIVFSDDKAYVEVFTMQENFEENEGAYVLQKSGVLDTSYAFADEHMGIANHALFEEFISNKHPEWEEEWVYLGQAGGRFGTVYSRGELTCDLYAVRDTNNVRYYCEYLTDLMDGDDYGVFEVTDGRMKEWLPEYEKTFEVNYDW